MTFGLSTFCFSAAVNVRRRKSCWRAMRPRSDEGSSCHLPSLVLVLEVAGADVLQCLVAVERVAARRRGTFRPVVESRTGYGNGTVTPPMPLRPIA